MKTHPTTTDVLYWVKHMLPDVGERECVPLIQGFPVPFTAPCQPVP